jgi:four helix bundle protein
MKNDNVIQTKSFKLAIKSIHLYQALVKQRNEFELSKQVLRSGTSIGANVEEALGAQSKKDFIAKMSIAYKEARETLYWIRLLEETQFINNTTAQSYLTDCNEILSILAKILKTSKLNLK